MHYLDILSTVKLFSSFFISGYSLLQATMLHAYIMHTFHGGKLTQLSDVFRLR